MGDGYNVNAEQLRAHARNVDVHGRPAAWVPKTRI